MSLHLRRTEDLDPEVMEAFFAADAAAYAGDPWRAVLPWPDHRSQLQPSNPFFQQGGEVLALVAEDGGSRGRVVAAVSPRLRTEAGAPLGLIGYFECVDDVAVSDALLREALGWLEGRGVRQVLGPMDLSTWYQYRFVTEGRESGPMLLEPYHPAHYPGQFERVGFLPSRTYASVRMPHTTVPILRRYHRSNTAAGVRFEPLAPADAADMLPVIYGMATKWFAGKTAYSEVTLEEFQRLSASVGQVMAPGLSLIAYQEETPVGYLFAYPDALEPARRGALGEAPQETILKTLAVDPQATPGLGWALCHEHILRAQEAGYRAGVYALMEKFEELTRWGRRTFPADSEDPCRIVRRYTLYERALGGS